MSGRHNTPGQQAGQWPECQRAVGGIAEPDGDGLADAPPDSGTAELRISTLGEFAVRSARLDPDGTPRWGRNDGCKLLKCLLAAPTFRRTRTQLMELLWPHFELPAARASLTHALSRLRHALEPVTTERASALCRQRP